MECALWCAPRGGQTISKLVVVVLAVLIAPAVRADVGDTYGLGSYHSALGGASIAKPRRGFGARLNPASLSHPDLPSVRMGYGFTFIQPNFTGIQNVTIENSYTSDDGSTRTGNVDTTYRSTIGQLIGLEYRPFEDRYRFAIGATTYIPLNQLVLLDTGETFIPEYVLYRANTQKPEFALALSISPFESFAIGVGGRMGFSATSRADVFLKTTDGEPSTMRFTSSIRPKISPYFSLSFFEESWSAGLSVQAPSSFDQTIRVDASAEAIAGLAGFPVQFDALSALYYEPLSIELAGSWKHSPRAELFLALEYQRWSLYRPPALEIQKSQAGSGIQVSPSINPQFNFRDIWIPRVGESVGLSDELELRFGYSFRPGIFSDPPNGVGNYLDPNRHSVSAGLGWIWERWTLDLHLSTHFLEAVTISKTSGNEAGDTSDNKIGAPGYEAGGFLYGFGASVTLSI